MRESKETKLLSDLKFTHQQTSNAIVQLMLDKNNNSKITSPLERSKKVKTEIKPMAIQVKEELIDKAKGTEEDEDSVDSDLEFFVIYLTSIKTKPAI